MNEYFKLVYVLLFGSKSYLCSEVMNIYTTQEIDRIFDANVRQENISTDEIVERASQSITNEIVSRWDKEVPLYVFAGPYRNGAYALATARHLLKKGYNVKVTFFNISIDPAQEHTKYQRDRLLAAGLPSQNLIEVTQNFTMPEFEKNAVVIDGLFGSELNTSLRTGYTLVIRHINENNLKVVSIDVPSGMTGDWNSRTSPNYVIRATLTIALQFPHLAFFLPSMSQNVGEWIVVDLGLKVINVAGNAPRYLLIGKHEASRFLQQRRLFSSKDDYGKGMIFAGSYGMMGAAVMAGVGALRAGIGKLTLCTPSSGYQIVQTSVPEALYQYADEPEFFSKMKTPYSCDSIAVGPGIGTQEKTINALEEFLTGVPSPIVLDADALNCISLRPTLLNKIPNMSIITPHAKEFDRLFGEQANGDERLLKAIEVSKLYNIIIVLKGHYTAVVRPDGMLTLNDSGTPAMATPGSGDVLTGIITAFYAQLKNPVLAAVAGVYVHGRAGEIAAEEHGSYGVLASDIANAVGKAIKEILKK